uniref:DNA polymerase III, delta subunit n=1 Tax=Candidatus Kentrum sp. TC TaxID=2126339 RepID=A0A451A016_9GAMM|nr:MAG: DNA polymerase III, delta subunit [Candidatus Kentron sp. TC]
MPAAHTGAAGNGKHAFAMRWGNALIREDTRPVMRPCRACRTCILFEPLPGKKNIGIDRIWEAIDRVWLSRQFADRKPVVVPGAEHITIQAAKTLLKTLEEPPGNAYLFCFRIEATNCPSPGEDTPRYRTAFHKDPSMLLTGRVKPFYGRVTAPDARQTKLNRMRSV